MPSLDQDPIYWRSIAELAKDDVFRQQLESEFPGQLSDEDPPESVSRRRFLQLLGASAALASMTACRWEDEKILPYAARPDGTVPGAPRYFATSYELGGVTHPILVTSRDGRPNKIEGNPDHIASLGASSTHSQSLMLGLCDPDRSRKLMKRESGGTASPSWPDFFAAMSERLAQSAENGGESFAVLTERTSSPTIARLRAQLTSRLPKLQWVEYEPAGHENVREGARLAYGRPLRTHYRLDRAKRILSLDEDLFDLHPEALRNTRDWADKRDPDGEMNRVYAVESSFTTTGANADHRLPLRAAQMDGFLRALEMALNNVGVPAGTPARAKDFIEVAAADLLAHKGEALVCVGRHLPAHVHALAHRINNTLSALGSTLLLTEEPVIDGTADLAALTASMNSGKIVDLLILGGNPVYDAPADLDFAKALGRVKNAAHLSLYDDETSDYCGWHLPRAHALESWGDGLAFDGSYCLTQPLIAPLFKGKSVIDVLAGIQAGRAVDAGAQVEATFRQQLSGADSKMWRQALHDGFVVDSAAAAATVSPVQFKLPELADHARLDKSAKDLELVFRPDVAVFDGRFANNGWLQEAPDFMTKLTWDNALMMSMADAEKRSLTTGSLVKMSLGGRDMDAAVYVLPGQPEGTATIHLGYGRSEAGVIGGSERQDVPAPGFNAYKIRTAAQKDIAQGLVVTATGGTYELACTQDHHAIDEIGQKGRDDRLGDLIREADLSEYKQHKDFAKHKVHHPPLESPWKEKSYDTGHKWGMAIDLNKCIGCNACVVGCQSENNIAIVGKEDVLKGREMHWIRIDRYFKGHFAEPEVLQQPVSCQHCELAPCEQVCPVAATVHSEEGLNDMVYNRCVGTRYCANNCPYKVRRFNFFDYHKDLKEPKNEVKKMTMNPDVTVRARGVMEKCTFCVQRIVSAKDKAANSNTALKDGDVQTACQQACSANAIVFGDLNDKNSKVAAAHSSERAYTMLSELNIKPRTQYLAKVKNKNPELVKRNS